MIFSAVRMSFSRHRHLLLLSALVASLGACRGDARDPGTPPLSMRSDARSDAPVDTLVDTLADITAAPAQRSVPAGSAKAPATAARGPSSGLPPNELGRIMVLEYHRLGEPESNWYRSPEHFKEDLTMLYGHGYRPVTIRQMVAGQMDVGKGMTPVVFAIDDSSLGQFYYLPDGSIDPNTMVGIWTDFRKAHPDWKNGAVWCVLPGAEYPSNFWGEKKSKKVPRKEREALIRRKVRFLIDNGHEICNHTMWHANLSKYSDAFVQDQIGSGQDSIQAYLPAGYEIVTFALPLGMWPATRSLAWHGTYRDGKTYDYAAVLEVSGGPSRSPYDIEFDPHAIERVVSAPGALRREITYFDRHPDERFVSDGDPDVITVPDSAVSRVARARFNGTAVRGVSGR